MLRANATSPPAVLISESIPVHTECGLVTRLELIYDHQHSAAISTAQHSSGSTRITCSSIVKNGGLLMQAVKTVCAAVRAPCGHRGSKGGKGVDAGALQLVSSSRADAIGLEAAGEGRLNVISACRTAWV